MNSKVFFHTRDWRNWACLLTLPILLSACERDKIQTYRVAKEKSVEASDSRMAADGNSSGIPQISYLLPIGWEEKARSRMRAASFQVQGTNGQVAEISVIPLPDSKTPDLEFVNLWREQVQLPPLQEGSAEAKGEEVAVGSSKGSMFDFVSEGPLVEDKYRARIVTVKTSQAGFNWFIKLSGEDSLVLKEKPAFLEFLKTIKFSAGMPDGHPPVSSKQNVAETSGGGKPSVPEWNVPANWKPGTPSTMRIASFQITNSEGTAELSVTAFPGEAGGLLPNINRWRGQIGLEPIDSSALSGITTPLDAKFPGAVIVDMKGQNPEHDTDTRILGAIIPLGSKTWFYKLTGDEAVLEYEKQAFVNFVRNVKYENAP